MSEIVVSPEPFSPRVERLEAVEGTTVAEMLTAACKLEVLAAADLPLVEVFVDGQRIVDREAALELRPHPGAVVNFVVLPQGGGGGGNKILTTLVEVALIAATAWIAGPALAGLKGVAGTVVRLGAISAVGIAGSAIAQSVDGHGPSQIGSVVG